MILRELQFALTVEERDVLVRTRAARSAIPYAHKAGLRAIRRDIGEYAQVHPNPNRKHAARWVLKGDEFRSLQWRIPLNRVKDMIELSHARDLNVQSAEPIDRHHHSPRRRQSKSGQV